MLYYIDVPKSQLPANFTTALINKGMHGFILKVQLSEKLA